MNSVIDLATENASWPVMLVDHTGAIRYANPAAKHLFAPVLDDAEATLSSFWAPENDRPLLDYLVESAQAGGMSRPVKLRGPNGQVTYRGLVIPKSTEGQGGYLLQLLPDPEAGLPVIDARQAVEASVAHKQKLDCALQLTRTVALDFNNALTSILGHTSLILSKMEPKHPWRSSLLEVEKSAEKAAEIAYDLAAFSRQEKDTRAQVAGNLNHLLRRTVELFQTPSHASLGWSLRLEPKLYAVVFDEAKMQQALMKILDNSIQAVGNGGQIIVGSRNLHVDDPLSDATVTLGPGDYVCIEIADNGCGIPQDVLPRIFEPFFSTKSGHRGLGLAWVYGIVTNHGGSVAVTSRAGQGTAVRVYLPAVKKFVRDTSVPDGNLGGNQTILLVDDEDILLTMGQMILSEFGYRVLIANSGHKALEIFGAEGEHIDLVITDLVMPHMSGRELMEQLRRLSPQIRILCASGFMSTANIEADDELYLQKPFTSQDLLRKVKQVLA